MSRVAVSIPILALLLASVPLAAGAASAPALSAPGLAQESVAPLSDFGLLVDALMSEEERAAWTLARTATARQAFVDRFWAIRDLTPGTARNEAREVFELRARRAGELFDEPGKPGYATDRGRVLLVLGLPDEQEMRAVVAGETPTISWLYVRDPVRGTIRFEAGSDGGFALATEPTLDNQSFLRSLERELQVLLANAVAGRRGVVVDPLPTAVEQAAADAAAAEGVVFEDPEPPVSVAPEVAVWMEMVFAGRMRDDLGMRHRVSYFPAPDGTYTVLSFKLDTERLEFTEPPVFDPSEIGTDDAASGEQPEAEPPPGGETVTEPPVAGGDQGDPGQADPDQADPDQALPDAMALDAELMVPAARLRVFGAVLEGEPGEENTLHSFLVPYALTEEQGDGARSPTLSVGVTLYPGTYRLAWGVLDETTGLAVTRDESIVVPDFTAPGLQLTRPLLAVPPHRDDPRAMTMDQVYEGVRLGGVLIDADVEQTFRRDDIVDVITIATGWASDTAAPGRPRLEVQYRILAGLEGERSIVRLDAQVLDFSVTAQQIPLAQVNRLQAGQQYRIEVQVRDLVSGEVAVQRVPITLTEPSDSLPEQTRFE